MQNMFKFKLKASDWASVKGKPEWCLRFIDFTVKYWPVVIFLLSKMGETFFFPPEFKQKLEVVFRCNHVLKFISISPKLASMVSEFIFWAIVLQSFWRLFSGFSLNTEHQWEQVFWNNESKFYIFEVGQRYSSESLQPFLKHAEALPWLVAAFQAVALGVVEKPIRFWCTMEHNLGKIWTVTD